MTNSIDLRRIAPVKVPNKTPKQQKPAETTATKSFQALLQQQLAGQSSLKFSKHALTRLESRNIELSTGDLTRIEGAVDQAAAKGAKDSLVLLQDLALIVSVTNRTVVTAVDGDSRKENIFTNIDSAVIL